jgi:hypothetical protein
MNLLRSKKGVYKDSFGIVIFLVTFGISLLFAFLILYNIMTSAVITNLMASTGVQAAIDLPARWISVFASFDYIFLLITIVLIIALMIISRKVATSKVFFIITFIMTPILGLISYVFNYLFKVIATHSSLSTVIAYFPKTILICTNLHWVALVAVVLGSISMYGKRDGLQDIPQGGDGFA